MSSPSMRIASPRLPRWAPGLVAVVAAALAGLPAILAGWSVVKWLLAALVVFLVAMPTWDAPAPAVSKKTRSPGAISDCSTAVPSSYWSKLVRGSFTPACLNAHSVRPEQSKPSGVVPADE